MKKILLLLLLLTSQLAYAQKFTLKGRATDQTSAVLPSATVLLLQPSDSALVSFGATNTEGHFEIKGVNRSNYLLKITFMGFAPYFKQITPPADGALLDLGTIALEPKSNELSEVLVKGEQSPVTIKKDTIEYNAGSFKTQPNAVVQDLLKQLPGVQVESDGSISVQGEKVQRVTVDGKEFFGKDPKLATQNLPADAVKKVQVFDKKSDQAEFTGIDDGKREKTINLSLKEDRRNSTFGKIMGGAGTDERYESKASLNRFSKGNQLSFLGMANNVGQQGFGFQDYMGFTGGGMQGGGGARRIVINSDNMDGVPLNFGGRSNGLVDTYAGGLNFNNQLGKNTEANGSYFLNHVTQDMRRNLERNSIWTDRENFQLNENTLQQSSRTGHRGNFSIDHKLDSANSVKLNGYLAYNKSLQDDRRTSRTIAAGSEQLLNQGYSNSVSDNSGYSFNTNLLLRHRFAKRGRTISLNTNLAGGNNESLDDLDYKLTFNNGLEETTRQQSEQQSSNSTLDANLSYTEPLGNRKYLEATYNYKLNLNSVDRKVFDLLGDAGREDNAELTNKFSSNYQYHKTGLNFKLNRRAYNLTLGSALQYADLAGELHTLKRKVGRDYYNVLPTAQFNYNFTSSRSLSLNYDTFVQEPTIQQLQPIQDNRNPLSIYIGNPALQPAYSHQWRADFNTFDPVRFINFFLMANATYTTNAIITAQTFSEQGVSTLQPVNVDDNLSMNLFANFGFPIKKWKSRFNFSTNLNEQQMISMFNEQEADVKIRSLGGNVRYEYRLDDKFDLSLRTNWTFQSTVSELGDAQNQRFFNKTYSAETNIYLPKSFNLSGNYSYYIYDNAKQDFRQTIPLLEVALAKQFLKNKSGELKLSAQNLLDKDTGVTQTANLNFVERATMNSLGRYFMLSFTYSLNKHMNPMNGRNGVRIISN